MQASPGPVSAESQSLRRQRVGEWLCELNLISTRQLAEAMELQRITGEKIGEILIQLGYLSDRELREMLPLQDVLASQGSLQDYPVNPDVLKLLSAGFCKQHIALPLTAVGGRLVVAVADRNNHESIELASLMSGHVILPVAFRHTDIQDAIGFLHDGVRAAPKPGNAAAPGHVAAPPKAPGAAPQGASAPPAAAAPQPEAANTSLRKQRLGDWLGDLNLISKRQLGEAMDIQAKTGQKLGSILVELGYLTEKELNDVLQLQATLSSHSALTDLSVDPNLLALLNLTFARQNHVMPLVKVGQRLLLALADPENLDLIDRTQLLTGCSIIPIAFRKEDVSAAIAHFYESPQPTEGGPASMSDRVATILSSESESSNKSARKETVNELTVDSDSNNVTLVNSVLMDAIDSGVSDIHIESTSRGLDIRLRLDGVMSKTMEVPPALAMPFVARIKVLAAMNMTENRRPQDGRFTMRHHGSNYDFRVSSIASHWGETVVIRILRPLAISGGLENLGCDALTLKKIRTLLGAPTGLLLVTGPTGSGKTSTLYACLGEMDRETDSIVTIEDPVEFPLDGIVQIQVQSKIGLNFAAALRTILRQDPDTVMLGEIRDQETLDAAVTAAMTGHLVLSTLHTNDAISTISRMQDMGAKGFQISSTLIGIVAQRLVRRICSSCLETYPATKSDKAFLGAAEDQTVMIARGKGCPTCKDSGYKGRVGVYEILQINRKLRFLINSNAPEAELWKTARETDFLTLLEDGKRKALQQLTTIEEVVRVLGDGALDS